MKKIIILATLTLAAAVLTEKFRARKKSIEDARIQGENLGRKIRHFDDQIDCAYVSITIVQALTYAQSTCNRIEDEIRFIRFPSRQRIAAWHRDLSDAEQIIDRLVRQCPGTRPRTSQVQGLSPLFQEEILETQKN